LVAWLRLFRMSRSISWSPRLAVSRQAGVAAGRTTARQPGLVVGRPGGAEVQVHPAALPLDLVVILGRTVQWSCEQRCCVMDGVLNGR
jgi:hypothetical protein